MEPRTTGTGVTRIALVASLVCLTVLLLFLGMVLTRSGPGIWIMVAFIGVPLWAAFAILERSHRSTG